MTNYNSKFKTSILIISIFYFLFSIFCVADAQASPQFLVSWRAQNYAPSWYPGKILPANKTPIEISFELIDNGKLADLSKTKVRWYINDNLIKNENDGLGIKKIKFNIPDYAGNETEVRIIVVDYLGGEQIDKIIAIPTVSPETVIEAPYLNGEIGVGTSNFRALPFFFNITNLNNLSVEWSANEQKSEGFFDNPWLLNLNIDSKTPLGTEIRLSALVKNPSKELEFASKNINLVIK